MASRSLLLSAFLLLTLALVSPSEAKLPLDICPFNPLGAQNYEGEPFRTCWGLCRTACRTDERSDGLCYRSKCICCIKDRSGGEDSGESHELPFGGFPGLAPGGKPLKCQKNHCDSAEVSHSIGEPVVFVFPKCRRKCKAKKELTMGTCGSGSCVCCVPKTAIPFDVTRELERLNANVAEAREVERLNANVAEEREVERLNANVAEEREVERLNANVADAREVERLNANVADAREVERLNANVAEEREVEG
ncbi:uncharacterized protein LOC135196840 [Macrobrachium nipponense]|uniref:uncharacterized protein LOC135196840 n=1 Tax=Macrobrachium nipponense TaxID=159736 RepID=UPI0030C82BF0